MRFLFPVLRFVCCVLALTVLAGGSRAHALDAVAVEGPGAVTELTGFVDRVPEEGGRIALEKPGGGELVLAKGEETERGTWWFLSLRNRSDAPVTRLLENRQAGLAGSGLVWPETGRERITRVETLEGIDAKLVEAVHAQRISLTIPPRQTVTLAMRAEEGAALRLYMWHPDAFAAYQARLALLQGALIGIAGLLFIYLTAIWILSGGVHTALGAGFMAAAVFALLTGFGYTGAMLDAGPGFEARLRFFSLGLLLTAGLAFGTRQLALAHHLPRLAEAMRFVVYGMGGVLLLTLIWPEAGGTVIRLGIALALAGASVLAFRIADEGARPAQLWLPALFFLDAAALVAGLSAMGVFFTGLMTEPAIAGLLVIALALTAFAIAYQVQTLRRRANIDALEVEQRHAFALAGARTSVWDWDILSDVLYVSPLLEAELGLETGALCGSELGWRERMHGDDRETYRNALNTYIAKGDTHFRIEFRLRDEADEHRWYALQATCMSGEEGYAVRCTGTVEDVTAERLGEERLMRDAVHDALTGLPNRALFLDRLARAVRRTDAFDGPRAALIVLDLDRFRVVNDTLGFGAGDTLLVTLARRLEGMIGPEDTVARMEGDEFAVLLTEGTAREDALERAAAILDVLGQPLELRGQEVYPVASAGLALCEDRHERPEDLLKEAEIALFHAKRSGKAGVELFTHDLREGMREQLPLEQDLRRAVEREEMEAYYQPIMSLADGRVAGFEALLRWHHPERGLLTPDDFIPLAEETGIIIDLGRFVLERAANDLSGWQKLFPLRRPLFVSVNVSSRQLLRHDLIQDIEEILAESKIEPASLKLEVTESLVMENPELAARMLRRIKKKGAGLSLDDFGTGYSSLSYIQRFPFDTLKIDRSFVSESPSKDEAYVIVQAMVMLAKGLGLDVVAEGVETVEQESHMTALGCGFAQGFRYGPAMRANEALKFIARHWQD